MAKTHKSASRVHLVALYPGPRFKRGLCTSLLRSHVPSPDSYAFLFFCLPSSTCSVHLLPLVAFPFPAADVAFLLRHCPRAPLQIQWPGGQVALKTKLPNQAEYGFFDWGPRSISWLRLLHAPATVCIGASLASKPCPVTISLPSPNVEQNQYHSRKHAFEPQKCDQYWSQKQDRALCGRRWRLQIWDPNFGTFLEPRKPVLRGTSFHCLDLA